MATATQKGKTPAGKAGDDNQTAAAEKASKTYIANRTVIHDQEEYGQGDDIVLTEKQAEPLLRIEAISDPDDDGSQA